MILSASIPLGNDGSCHACGPTYNLITYDYDSVTDVHKVWAAVGCLDGGSAEGGEDTVIAFLENYRHDWPGGGEVGELITWLTRYQESFF